MNATDFIDHYEEALDATLHAGPVHDRQAILERNKHFREVRRELRAKGVTDADILAKIGEIMGIIMAHLGNIAQILALVLPLFITPAPAESDE